MILESPHFERVGRRAVLTYLGEALIPCASQILKTQKAIFTLMCLSAPEEISGTLRTAVHALGRTIHPEIQSVNSTILINLTRQDLGVSFLPEYLVRHSWLEGTVALLPSLIFSDVPDPCILSYEKCLSPMITGLIEIIEDRWASIDPMPAAQSQTRSMKGVMI